MHVHRGFYAILGATVFMAACHPTAPTTPRPGVPPIAAEPESEETLGAPETEKAAEPPSSSEPVPELPAEGQ